MIPVDQTLFGGDVGNCLPACVATIFGLRLDDVPNVCAHDNKRWWADLVVWAADALGHCPLLIRLADQPIQVEDAALVLDEILPGAPSIVSGQAERGHMHATVWVGGRMAHDPHPSRAGLLEVADVTVFVPLRPASTVEFEAVKREICESAGRQWAYPSSGGSDWCREFERGRQLEAERRGWHDLYGEGA